MARPKTIQHEPEAPAIELISPDVVDEMPDEIALDRLLNELGLEERPAKVSIWRVNEEHTGRGAAKDMFLGAMSPGDFQDYGLMGIQNDYGEGRYRVKIFDGENGHMLHNRIFVVGPPPKSRVIPVAPPPAANGADGFAALAQAMQNGFSSLAQIMLRQGETQVSNRKAMLDELMLYKNLFTPAQSSTGDPVTAITSAMSLLKEFGVGNGSGKETTATDVFLELAKEFGPAIAQIAQQQTTAARGVRPALAPVQPAPQLAPQLAQAAPPMQPGPPAPAEETAPMDTVTIGLRMYLPTFIQQAQAGNDPYKYADVILDHVSIDQAEQFAHRPDWFEYLCAINPGVAANAAWFTQLRQHLLEIIAQERAEDSADLTWRQAVESNTPGKPDSE